MLSPLAGRLMGRTGPRLPLVLSGTALAASGVMLAQIASTTTPAWLFLSYAMFGIGFGLQNPVVFAVAVSGMPPAQAGVAAGIASAARQVGAAIGDRRRDPGCRGQRPLSWGGRARPGPSLAPGWWVIAGIGVAIAVLGRVSTTARAAPTATSASGEVALAEALSDTATRLPTHCAAPLWCPARLWSSGIGTAAPPPLRDGVGSVRRGCQPQHPVAAEPAGATAARAGARGYDAGHGSFMMIVASRRMDGGREAFMTPSSLGRGELGATLRAWRNRVSPADVGLKDAGPRRTAGLRRSELARIAGISPDYLTQLEQGRAATPSAQVLGALARALRISATEIGQLFRLAGLSEPDRHRVLRQLPSDVSRMIDGLNHAPVSVYDARWDPIAWNPLWAAVMGDPAGRPLPERNLARRQFLGLPTRVVRDCEATAEFEHALAADLRGTAVRYPGDPALAALIAELGRSSERFRTRWDSRPAGVYEAEVKTVDHPEAGAFTMACTVLTTRRDDLRVVIYTPDGPAASRAVRRLRDDSDDALVLT